MHKTDYRLCLGKSKAQAKSAASEAVIRYIFLKRVNKDVHSTAPQPIKQDQLPIKQEQQPIKQEQQPNADLIDGNNDVQMEEVEDEEDEEMLFSWSHIASFALHKLLTSWDEGGSFINAINGNTAKVQSVTCTKPEVKSEMKPAKKLPENASTKNPIMLIYQMRPNTIFQELSVVSTPPKVMFSFKCLVDDQEFTGHGNILYSHIIISCNLHFVFLGPNKKTARKCAAYHACRSLLNIEYPPEVLAEISTYEN